MRNGNGNHQRLQKSKAVTETSATYWVENALYRSLAELIGPIGLSAGKTGNVWEQLCWHAYEHDKCAFILAVIWNTSNRRLWQHAATSQGYRNAHTDDPSAHMPPKGERLTMVGGSVSSDLHPAEYVGLANAKLEKSMEQAANLRNWKNPGGLHNAMRAKLQVVVAASEENPYECGREVPPTLPQRRRKATRTILQRVLEEVVMQQWIDEVVFQNPPLVQRWIDISKHLMARYQMEVRTMMVQAFNKRPSSLQEHWRPIVQKLAGKYLSRTICQIRVK